MKRLKIFFVNTIILIFTSIFLRVIGMFFNVYISNKIGQEALGVFHLIMSVYMFGISFACSGINIATTKIVAEEFALGNQTNINKIASKCISISFITGILASSLLFLGSDSIMRYCLYDKVSKSVIYCLCIALPFISMSSAINGYFTAIRKVYINATGKIFEQFIKIAITTYLVSLFLPSTLNNACYALILGDVISEVATFIFNYCFYIHEKRKSYLRIDVHSYTRRILSVSLPIAFTSYIRSGLSTLKQTLIPSRLERSGIASSLAISKYGVITGMVMPIIMFPRVFIESFSDLLIPEFSRYYARKDYNRMMQVTKLILFLTSVFSIFITIILFIFSNEISVCIYNNLEVGTYIKLVCPIVIFMYIDTVIDSILKGVDEQLNVMLVNVVDLIVSVAFIYFFVPIFGFSGYVFSIFLSELLNFALSGLKLVKILKN